MCNFAGETPSGVIVLESAVRQYEDVLGIRHPGISTLSKKAEKLLSNLEPEQREQVCCNKGHDVCFTAPTCNSWQLLSCTMPATQSAVMLYPAVSCCAVVVCSAAVLCCAVLCCAVMLCCGVKLCCHVMLCCAMLSLLTAPNDLIEVLHT